MRLYETSVRKLLISEIENLDPISVYLEDFSKGKGRIVIECFGKSWAAYWGAMGEDTIAQFFCSCDEHYLAKNLASRLNDYVPDIDKIKNDAAAYGVDCWRDDPWNDYGFMSQMYGPDMVDWSDLIPKKVNPEYRHLCRIINAVKEGLEQYNKGEVDHADA